ncbi:hypothetical protein [Roseateles sp.]|uniref:hypothetical protein n=1 Tax=Roseateles sp. TaxID=1971397 RepID=UPI002F3F99E4
MTWRSDSTQLIPGCWVSSRYAGHGITGAAMRAATGEGQDGPGLGYDEWDGSADDTAEFRWTIATPLSAGVLVLEEDGSGGSTDALPDGLHSAAIQTWCNGVALGAPQPLTVQVGEGGETPEAITMVVAGQETGHDVASFSITVQAPVEPVDPITVAVAGVEQGHDAFHAVVSVGPAQGGWMEPVTVEQAALAARVDEVDELYDLIATLITTARESAEHITGRFYRTGVYVWDGMNWPTVVLQVVDVTSAKVTYWNGTAMVELASGAYVCTPAVGRPGTVFAPAIGQALPQLASIAAGARVRIELTVNVDPLTVPASVQTYIKAQVSAWLKNPEALTAAAVAANPLYERLLDRQRIYFH